MPLNKLPKLIPGLLLEPVADETIVYLPGQEQVQCLKAESAYVLEACELGSEVRSTQAGLSSKFGVENPEQRLKNHLIEFSQNGLLAESGMSRRAFGTFCAKVAAPAIIAVTMSTPAAAASCVLGAAGCAASTCGCPCRNNAGDPCNRVCQPRFRRSNATVANAGNIAGLLAGDSPEPQTCRLDNSNTYLPPMTCVDARNATTVGSVYKCCP